jgi:hypothetical protein
MTTATIEGKLDRQFDLTISEDADCRDEEYSMYSTTTDQIVGRNDHKVSSVRDGEDSKV